MISRFLQQPGDLWVAGRCLFALLGLVLLLASCNTSNNSGSLSPSSTLSPQSEQQAIENLLQEYRTAFLQEDIDRLQALLSLADVPPQGAPLTPRSGLRQEGGADVNAQAFRDALTRTFQTLTVTALDIPNPEIRVAPDRRSVSFLEVESTLEAEHGADPTTLIQRTQAFRSTFRLVRDEAQDIVTFRIAAAGREGPLLQVATRGQVVAGALARVEVTAGTWPLRGGEIEVPETGVVQALVSTAGIFHSLFTPAAQPAPQPLLVRLRGANGEETVLRHPYQLRVPGEGALHRIAATGAARFFAVALAPDGTAWFGGEIGGSPETAEAIRVGNVVQVTADGQAILSLVQPTINQRPSEAVAAARIEDIVIDQLGRVHFLFIAQNAAERVVGNGDIVFDPRYPSTLCQTVNAFNAPGVNASNYPFQVLDPQTDQMRASPSTRAVAGSGGNVWLLGSDGGVALVADAFREGNCPQDGGSVRYHPVFRRGESGLLSNSVLALVVEADMPRWFGTAVGVQDGQFTAVPFRPGFSFRGNVATLEALFRDIARAIFEARPIATVDDVAGSLLKGDLIFSAVVDAQGRLWVGTLGAGIRRIEAHGELFRDTLLLTRDEVARVAPDSGNRTVVSRPGLGSNIILALAVAPDGAIWAATDEGVSRIQEHNGVVTLTNFSALDGLTPPVRDAAIGRDGTAWLATDGGLFRIVPQGGQVQGVVRDRSGRPLAGVDVIVRDTPFRAVTDAAGHFALTNLPPGPQLLQFEGGLAPGGPFISTFRAAEITVGDQMLEAVELVPEASSGFQLVSLSGDEQTGLVQTPLPLPLTVEVRNVQGNPVPGIPVTFRILQGTGILAAAVVTTDVNGQASTTLTVGPSAGQIRVEARAEGLGLVVFTALAQDMVRLLAVSGNNQIAAPGEALPEPLVVRLEDRFGNPLEGVAVTAQVVQGQAAFLSPALVATDTQGEARFSLRVGANEEGIVTRVSVPGQEQESEGFLTVVGFASPVDIAVDRADGSLVGVDGGLGVLRVDPDTGNLTLVSQPGLRGAGPSFASPIAIAVEADGSLVVAGSRSGFGVVIRVNPSTGYRTVVSGCVEVGFDPITRNFRCVGGLIGSGPSLGSPRDIAVEADGALVLVEFNRVVRVEPGSGNRDLVLGVNPDTGAIMGSGPLPRLLRSIAVEADGALVVVGGNAVVRVEPSSGNRRLVSGVDPDTGTPMGSGPLPRVLRGIAVEADGSLVLVEFDRVLRVEPASGNRRLVSGVDSDAGARMGSGEPFISLESIAVEADGSLVVVDRLFTPFVRVTRVEPVTGDRSLVAGPGFRGSGLPFIVPEAIAVDADGSLVVLNSQMGFAVVVRVEPLTGDRTVISGCLEIGLDPNGGPLPVCVGGLKASGPLPRSLRGIAVEASGALVVAGGNAVIRVDPANSGNRRLVSGSDSDTGPVVGGGTLFGFLEAVAVEASGSLVVGDVNLRAVLRVDPNTGERRVLSGCAAIDPSTRSCSGSPQGSGPLFGRPAAIAVEASGSLVVGDFNLRAVLRVDPNTGERRVLSGCAAVAPPARSCSGSPQGSGPLFGNPAAIAVEANGSLVVGDTDLRAVLRVDPNTGERRVLSGCAAMDMLNNCTGALRGGGVPFRLPTAIAVRKDGSLVVTDDGLSSVVRVDPVTGERTILAR